MTCHRAGYTTVLIRAKRNDDMSSYNKLTSLSAGFSYWSHAWMLRREWRQLVHQDLQCDLELYPQRGKR